MEFFEEGKGTRLVIVHEGCPGEFFGQNVSRTSESFEKLDLLLAAQAEALSR